jgi:hypothetical protein
MPKPKDSWTKIATLTAFACCCLGLLFGFWVWFDKHYYIRFPDDPEVARNISGSTSGSPSEVNIDSRR